MLLFQTALLAALASTVLPNSFAKVPSSNAGFRHVALGSSPVRKNVVIPRAEHSLTMHPVPASSYQTQIRKELQSYSGTVAPLAGDLTVESYAVNVTAGNQHFALLIDTGRLVSDGRIGWAFN